MLKKSILLLLLGTLTLLTFLGIVFIAAENSSNNAIKNSLGSETTYFTETFDAWTLCVAGLSFSGYDETKSTIWNSVMAPQLIGNGGKTPCEILIGFSQNKNYPQNYTTYSRYWHGSGAIFVIISSLTSFEGFKSLYYLFTIFSLVFFGSMWSNSTFKATPIYFLIPLLLGSNQLLFQNNFVHILPFLSALITGGIIGRIQEKMQFVVILIAGMWVNFLDLLTSPFLFFSITLFAYLVPKMNQGAMAALKHFIVSSFLWFSGFFGTWISKWLFAEFFGQRGEIRKAIDQSLLRTSGPVFNDVNPSMFYPAFTNFKDYLAQPISSWGINSTFIGLIIILISLVIFRELKFLGAMTLYISLSTLLLVLWYAIFRNHSLIHSWFTFRSIAVIPSLIIALSYYYLNYSIRNRRERILN